MRTLTPEQRARKQQADRDRRAAKKAGTFTPKQAAQHIQAVSAPALTPPPRSAEEPMEVVAFRATEKQKRLFYAAGGGAWLRRVLDDGAASGHIKLGTT